MKCWNPASLSADEHAGGGGAKLMFAQAACSAGRHFIIVAERRRTTLKAETSADTRLQCSGWGEVSKQSPGAGVFRWTKLPAPRLHVGQVNKTQWRGLEGWRGATGKPMVVFSQTGGDAGMQMQWQVFSLGQNCPATPSVMYRHCVIQSQHFAEWYVHQACHNQQTAKKSLCTVSKVNSTLYKSVLIHMGDFTYCLLLAPTTKVPNKHNLFCCFLAEKRVLSTLSLASFLCF